MPQALKSRRVAIVLASIPYTAWLGADRFYLGRYFTGVLKLLVSAVTVCATVFLTSSELPGYPAHLRVAVLPFLLGMFAWYIADIVRTASSTATDKWGRPLLRRPPAQPVAPAPSVVYGNPVYPSPAGTGIPVYTGYPYSRQPPKIHKKVNPLAIVAAVVWTTAAATLYCAYIVHFLDGIGVRNELTLQELSIRYPVIGWMKESSRNSDEACIAKGDAQIFLYYNQTKAYHTSLSAAETVLLGFEDTVDGFRTTGDMQEVIINETAWQKIPFSYAADGNARKGVMLVCSTDYEIYAMIYSAEQNDYEQYLEEAEAIMGSARLPIKEKNSPAVIQRIAGEWDCGDTGYFVINNDNTYIIYRDSSKSEDNAIYGSYDATDGIATYAAGYVDGITFIATVRKAVVDGVEEPSAAGSRVAYAFAPDDTENWIGSNLNTGSHFQMTRVK